jgi:hypothetical protein
MSRLCDKERSFDCSYVQNASRKTHQKLDMVDISELRDEKIRVEIIMFSIMTLRTAKFSYTVHILAIFKVYNF